MVLDSSPGSLTQKLAPHLPEGWGRGCYEEGREDPGSPIVGDSAKGDEPERSFPSIRPRWVQVLSTVRDMLGLIFSKSETANSSDQLS